MVGVYIFVSLIFGLIFTAFGALVGYFTNEAEHKPTRYNDRGRQDSLEEIAGNVERFEAWEVEYQNARTEKHKRQCEAEALEAFQEIEKAYNKLRRQLVKEVEK